MDVVLMITGSYPPAICGVGDYTRNVLGSEAGGDWKLYHRTDWRLSQLPTIVQEIDAFAADRIFMQYPTQGYGWSLVPHLLCAYYSLVRKAHFTVVLHEYSQLSAKARTAATLIVKTAHRLIFTNEFEQAEAARVSASVPHRSRVVKIASNIPVAAESPPTGARQFDLGYFGHIRPRKGLDEFLALLAAARAAHPDWRLLLMGQIPPGFEGFARDVLEKCRGLGVELRLDLDAEVVADVLAQVKVVYLPFPDGISERRGTAMAAMANGAIVLTTVGHHTTPTLRDAVRVVPAHKALQAIEQTLSSNEDALARQQSAAKTYLREHIPTSWDAVARAYLN